MLWKNKALVLYACFLHHLGPTRNELNLPDLLACRSIDSRKFAEDLKPQPIDHIYEGRFASEKIFHTQTMHGNRSKPCPHSILQIFHLRPQPIDHIYEGRFASHKIFHAQTMGIVQSPAFTRSFFSSYFN